MEQYEVIVIGGGPGGYVAAIRASQLGLKTALIEKESLGGTCLNWGCVPTKSLLRNAEVIHLLSEGRSFGFSFENLTVDYGAAYKRSRQVVSRQTKRIGFLMKNNKIAVYEGTARFESPNEIVIDPSGEALHAENIIIATGAKSRQIPGVDFDGEKIITFRRALELNEVPSSAVIVGAGPIGMEFATVWNRYGSKVTVVELLPHALPLEDEDISIEAEKQFKRARISVKTGAMVEGITTTANGVDVTVAAGDERQTISVEKVLIAIGFVPNSEDLGLENTGVATTRGNIGIDEQMRTSVEHIFAIGDVTGKLGLAHVASTQALIAAEAIAGNETPTLDYVNIPRCTYAFPEVASVGLTEKQAREQGFDVATAQSPFVANGKALAMNENFGFVKIVSEAETNKILGVHMVGAHVTELIAGPTGMITLESNAEDLARTIHPHPTLSEVVMEAAYTLTGKTLHG